MSTEGFRKYVDVYCAISQIQAADLESTELGAQALNRAEELLTELAGSDAVSSAIHEYYDGAHSQLGQLDQLEAVALGAGLVTKEELDAKRTEITNTDEFAAAAYFMKTVGSTALSGVTESSSVAFLEADVEKTPRDIQITIQGDGVQIGKQGKFVRLSGAHSKDQTDYSVLRKTLLKTLIEKQGDYMSVDELWSESFPGVEFDRDSMRQFKMWADGLTFRGRPIIVHNGKRGSSSAYGILSFNVSLSEVTKAAKQKPAEEYLPEVVSEKLITQDRQHTYSTPEDIKRPEAPAPETAPEVHFPLGLTESYILAETLAYLDSICKRHGIPIIDERIVQELSKQTTTKDVLAVTAKRDIEDVRGEIVEKVVSYFENEGLVLDDIGNMNEKDHRFGLFNYLIDIDWQERSMLILTMAKGYTRLDVSMGGKRGLDLLAARLQAEGYPLVTGENGAKLRVGFDEERDDNLGSVTVQADQVDGGGEDFEQEIQADVAPDLDTSATLLELVTQPEQEPEGSEAGLHSQAEREVDWEQLFQQDVQSAIVALVSDNLLSKQQDPADTRSARVINTMSSSAKMGTEESINRLRQAGIMRRDRRTNPADVQISARELVCMYVFNANRQILGHKGKQRRALKIIDAELATFFK